MPIDPPNSPPPSFSQLAPLRLQINRPDGLIAKKDVFANLDELKSELSEGKDYKIVFKDRNFKATIVSPHGGGIEAGTSELARAIASDKYNLFDFFAKSHKARICGHVTSSHFREERLSNLLKKSQICVSIHRMKDKHSVLYLGGANLELKKIAANELSKFGFQCSINPPRLKGLSKENFVNMAKQAGLQIEIPKVLANKLIPNVDSFYKTDENYCIQESKTKCFNNFVLAIDTAIATYLAKQN